MNKLKLSDIITLCFLGLCFIAITFLYLKGNSDKNTESEEVSSVEKITLSYIDGGNPIRTTVISPNTDKRPEEIKEELSVVESEESTSSDESKFEVGEKCDVPDIPTHVKFCTDYRAYNLWYTPHYRLQQGAWTDEYGLRRYNDDYLVALGSYYSTDIGDRFEVTLDTGKIFTVMMADGKWDIDCDENNMYTPCVDYNGEEAGNLLEFIIDKYSVSNEMYDYGSLDYYDGFKGSVVKMVYLGRDDSADWDTYHLKKGG